jgi:hypothetical protein
MPHLIPMESIVKRIYFIRDLKVMLDTDLAQLYGVSTKRLNEQVKRNQERFPPAYMLRLTLDETAELIRSHFATGSKRNIRYLPYAFTEHGAIMLASVLKSPIAIKASIAVVNAFVRLREILTTNQELARKLEELENKLIAHDYQIADIVKAIRGLMKPAGKPKPKPNPPGEGVQT